MIPPLLGVTDVARELGWGKARVSEYRSRGKFPEPATQIGGRPVWTKKQVDRFKKEKKEELKMKEAIKNIRNFTFEQAQKEYEEVKKTINPRIHDVHLTLTKDGKPFLKRCQLFHPVGISTTVD